MREAELGRDIEHFFGLVCWGGGGGGGEEVVVVAVVGWGPCRGYKNVHNRNVKRLLHSLQRGCIVYFCHDIMAAILESNKCP